MTRVWDQVRDQRIQLLFFSFVFIFGVLGSLFALVKDPAVRISEISKFSTLMVTVTGILVGLSPLIQKDRRRGVNLGIISLLVSLVTVVIADTATPDQSTYVSEVFVLGLILFVIAVLVYATYATVPRQSEQASGSSHLSVSCIRNRVVLLADPTQPLT